MSTRSITLRKDAGLPVRIGMKVLQWAICAGLVWLIWTQVLEVHFSKAFFVGPDTTWHRLVDFYNDGTFWSMIRITLSESLAGFAIGTAVGIILALAIGMSADLIGKAFEPFIAAIYALPKFVLAPVLFVWIGSGFVSRMYLVMTAVFPVVTIMMVSGIRTVDQNMVRNMQLLGASRVTISRKLLLPHTLGYLITAITLVLPQSLTFALGAEILLGSQNGIGGVISSQGALFNSGGVLAALVVGTALSAICIWVARRVGAKLLGPMPTRSL